jgi:SP family arabinose:H+ symporter-like MFS transporter
MPILINMLQFIGAILTSYLLTKIGRKILLEMGALICAIANIIIAIGFLSHSLAWILLGLIVFMGGFGLTLGPVVWIYLPEVAQPKILSLATAANWGGCSLVMLTFPIITKMLPGQNPGPIFLFFCLWSVGSYFFNKRYVLETQNKGEKQIFNEYAALEPIF